MGMRLRIERHNAIDRAIRPGQRQMLWRPPGAGRRRPAFLEGLQESVANGRIDIARAGIPCRGRYLGDCAMHPNGDGATGVVHRLTGPRFTTRYAPTLSIIA